MSRKLEGVTHNTFVWLNKKAFGCGFKGMNFPRWESIRYCAKEALKDWSLETSHTKKTAVRTIGFQPFSGLRPEWVEEEFK